jgi:RNA polymerase sigma-70 factor (ECF subfamily)
MESDQPADTKSLFEELFRDFRGPILNYLYRLIGDASRAEELTQDVFVKAYRALVRLPADANHRAWLYRIATNTAYDHLRRRKLVQWLPLLDRDVPDLAHNNPETALGEQESVQQALDQLAPKYRAPLILYSVQGYSIKEIGAMLNISEGAVKTRLYRAREAFRKVYGEES